MAFKFSKKRNRFEKSNLWIDLDNMVGFSYHWYKILDQIDSHVIVNSYNYSHSTIKHFRDVTFFLRSRGIDFVCIEAPNGLQNLEASIRHYRTSIRSIKDDLANPRKRPNTKEALAEALKAQEKYLEFVEELVFSKAFESQISEALDADAV